MSNEMYNTIARVTDGIYEGEFLFYVESLLMNVSSCLSFLKNLKRSLCFGMAAGIAIGGDVFPGSTLSDHILRFNNIPQVY